MCSLLLYNVREKYASGLPKKELPEGSSFKKLSFDPEPFLAAGADYGMLALCLGQTEDRLAGLTFTVDVSFSVAKFISAKLEKTAEFFVFTSALIYIS